MRAFIDDPLCTTVPMGKKFGLFGQLQMLGGRARSCGSAGRDIPILLLVGRDDPVGGPRSVHRLADAYRTASEFTDVTTLRLPGRRHEIFNEVGQEKVRADLLAWLDARLPAATERVAASETSTPAPLTWERSRAILAPVTCMGALPRRPGILRADDDVGSRSTMTPGEHTA